MKRRALATAFACLLALACKDTTAPKLEPDPFPDAIALKIWLQATGMLVREGNSVRMVVAAFDTSTNDMHTFPPGFGATWPYRIAWWTSDPKVALISDSGVLMTKAAGKVEVWVQVEGGRDSATVVVGTGSGGAAEHFVVAGPGGNHTCALGGTGTAYCWGSDFEGALGTGALRAFTSALAPVPVAGAHTFAALSAGMDFTCALTSDGQAYCWGSDFWGEIGDGANYDDFTEDWTFGRPAPTPVGGGLHLSSLAAGGSNACGLDAGGAAYCWGWDAFGQAGAGSPSQDLSSRTQPVAVVGGLTFASLAGGAMHMCGLTPQGSAYCWGNNLEGELGHDPALDTACGGGWPCSPRPAAVPVAFAFKALTAGAAHTCGLDTSGAAWCWGVNFGWQLGTDSVGKTYVPLPVNTPLRFTTVSAGGAYTCGLTADGTAYCWGDNLFGELGIGLSGPPYAYAQPQQVAGGHAFRALEAGGRTTCGIDVAGALYCWGWDHMGQVGDGSMQPPNARSYRIITAPVRVLDPLAP